MPRWRPLRSCACLRGAAAPRPRGAVALLAARSPRRRPPHPHNRGTGWQRRRAAAACLVVDGGVNGVGIRLGLECVYMGLGYICSWVFFDIWVTFCIRSCFMLFYVKLNNYLIIYFYFLYILAYPRILIF